MTTRCKDHHPFIDSYIDGILSGRTVASKRLIKAMVYIDKKLANPDVFIDSDKIDKAIDLMQRYFGFQFLDWELFVVALVHCYYKSTDTVVFREFLIVMGRGNGKNGFISPLAWYLTTHYHGVQGYNVDIIANSEEQAKTSFNDIYEMLGNNWAKLKKFFYKSKVQITNLKTSSYIKFNTSNARTKDGKRSACLIFDEEHEYESEENIKVFSSGFGKRKHSRKFKITSQGYVRDGVLDNDLRLADDLLNGIITDLDICPLIYEVDSEEEVMDPACWPKANPSFHALPELRKEIEAAVKEMKYKPGVKQDFYTKRMNFPIVDREVAVTSWDNLLAASRELPDLTGRDCIAGIDYAMLSDMASCGLWFRIGEERFWIQRSWISRQSGTWDMIRAPLNEWSERGDLVIVDDVQISPLLIVAWLEEQMQKYNIVKLALDNARLALMREALESIGFSKENNNLWIVRPLGIVSAAPVIDYLFDKHLIAFGDVPLVRWAVNNTKKKPTGDVGNFKYDKIEPKSRKTDPFMAMVAAVTCDSELSEGVSSESPDLPCFTF